MEYWLQNNWIELAGFFLAIIYLFLSIKENIWLWPLGFLASSFYLVVFFQSRLYADMSLQVYYLIVSVYGWYNWMGKRNSKQKVSTNLATISINKRQWLLFLLITALLTLVIYLALKKIPAMLDLPDSALPLGDAFTTAASIVATWMLARKMLENWLFWIIVDAFSMVMYLCKELYITAILFFVYTVMAIIGYVIWKSKMADKFSAING